jgi:hypothetical protein
MRCPINKFVTKTRIVLLHPITWITLIWLSAVVSRLIKHGDVYGLNYGLFHPDGALYHAFTLWLQGNSWDVATLKVNTFFFEQTGTSYLGTSIDSATQRVIQTRPLFSFLSLPFVFAFGQMGMLAIPILSLLVVGLVLYSIGVKVERPYLAVVIYLVLSLSTSVTRWMVADLTDSLLVAIVALIYWSLTRENPKRVFVILVFLALLTRPSGPLIIAALIPFIRTFRTIWTFAAIGISAFGTILLALYSPEAAGAQTSGDYTVINRVQDFALHLVKVVIVEFGQLFVMDRILFLFLITVLGVATITWRQKYSQSFLLLLGTSFLMGAWNGALGVNFRYELPSLVAGAIVLIFSASELGVRLRMLLRTPSQN